MPFKACFVYVYPDYGRKTGNVPKMITRPICGGKRRFFSANSGLGNANKPLCHMIWGRLRFLRWCYTFKVINKSGKSRWVFAIKYR